MLYFVYFTRLSAVNVEKLNSGNNIDDVYILIEGNCTKKGGNSTKEDQRNFKLCVLGVLRSFLFA